MTACRFVNDSASSAIFISERSVSGGASVILISKRSDGASLKFISKLSVGDGPLDRMNGDGVDLNLMQPQNIFVCYLPILNILSGG
jgi:hypothetical protein